jgi:hypothetical protein
MPIVAAVLAGFALIVMNSPRSEIDDAIDRQAAKARAVAAQDEARRACERARELADRANGL